MNSSMLPPVAPAKVKLTQAGQAYWNKWNSVNDACAPTDVFRVGGTKMYKNVEHYFIQQTVRGQETIWIEWYHCIGVVLNDQHEWEEIK